MTPTIISKELLPLNNKLKYLLTSEFLKQQPDSKQEKADILEMTLNFLQRHDSSSHAVNRGFSRCVGEIVHFLSKDEMKTQSQRRLLQTSCEQNRRESVLPDQKTFSKETNVNKSAIWRPW
ncbi:hypothetical protein Q8A67_021954 [Cirrhinus molitorella]|uniref:BHLH domain-containing protein n=1 Tax=Cirrhinus molitorella TaxID=172907 RepID=A0AA88PIL6_9TELE|nr:hypothetical protein Q8A67_021954 [Cirrhinus molitorella]